MTQKNNNNVESFNWDNYENNAQLIKNELVAKLTKAKTAKCRAERELRVATRKVEKIEKELNLVSKYAGLQELNQHHDLKITFDCTNTIYTAKKRTITIYKNTNNVWCIIIENQCEAYASSILSVEILWN